MERPALALLTAVCFCPAFFAGAGSARALDVSVPPGMQNCANDSDCTMVDGQCGTACSFVPMNRQYASNFDDQKKITCGEQSPGAEAQCVTQPALNPTCVNRRCTIGTAWQEHADAKDYLKNSETVRPAGTQGAMQPEYASPSTAVSIRPSGTGDYRPYPDTSRNAGGNQDYYLNPRFDDKHGFTAYDLPDQGAGTTRSLGEMDVRQQ